MRKIKFRIWSKKYEMFSHNCMWPNNQHTSEIFLLDGIGNLREFITCDGENFFWDLTNNKPGDLIAQQFAGLKDKNNKEIYEGDIVKYKYKYHFDITGEAIHEVKFNNGEFSPLPKDSIVEEDDFYSYYISDYEVIGNIFENPELINNK